MLEGAVSVRHPDGTDVLGPGDTAAFPVGPEGAHKVFNASEETVRFMMLSTKGEPGVRGLPRLEQDPVLQRAAGGARARRASARTSTTTTARLS